MTTATISAKGWVVIPAKERKELGLAPGSKVVIRRDGDGVRISPLPDAPVAAMCGMLKSKERLTVCLVEEHRKEVERDEKRSRPRM
ncbi:MAG: AbrB/MazE/SpoVT family DNA-binding domain-containing protein [Acidobacteriota bacterium]|jgi:AbrB family looped-hinge helix DNA binding protein|nr:AbrB/MazE/SpoVT family DNA-binding domain-containing protein [Acidobacteriota bacterium]